MRNMFERETQLMQIKILGKDLELHQVHSNCSVNVRSYHYYNIHYFLLYCIVIWGTALLSTRDHQLIQGTVSSARVCDPYKHLIQFLQWNPYPLIDSFNIAIEQMVAFDLSDGHLGFFLYSKYTLSIFILTLKYHVVCIKQMALALSDCNAKLVCITYETFSHMEHNYKPRRRRLGAAIGAGSETP